MEVGFEFSKEPPDGTYSVLGERALIVIVVSRKILPGDEDTYQSYGVARANASNTPFRRYKHWVHEGGIATPLKLRNIEEQARIRGDDYLPEEQIARLGALDVGGASKRMHA